MHLFNKFVFKKMSESFITTVALFIGLVFVGYFLLNAFVTMNRPYHRNKNRGSNIVPADESA